MEKEIEDGIYKIQEKMRSFGIVDIEGVPFRIKNFNVSFNYNGEMMYEISGEYWHKRK